MKAPSKNKGKYTIHFIILSLLMSIVIISCGGCKVSKVATIATSNSKTEEKNDTQKPLKENGQASNNQYPYTDGLTIYINDSTKIVEGMKVVEINYRITNLIFPNGKVITKNDYPIVKDLPDKYKNNHEYKSDGYIDLAKLDRSKKRSLLSKMDGYDPDDIDNYVQADISYYTHGLHDSLEERVYFISDLQIWKENKKSEDDIRREIVGQIGGMEIYDKKGNKLYDVKLDKFGCEQFCITPDKRHIIINTNGHDDSDKNMDNRGAITIWDYDNPKMIGYVYHYPEYFSDGMGCLNNNAGIVSYSDNRDSIYNVEVIFDEKLVTPLEYPSSKRFQVNFNAKDGGSYHFRDGTIFKNGSSGFKQYSIEEWNRHVDLLWKKKHTANED